MKQTIIRGGDETSEVLLFDDNGKSFENELICNDIEQVAQEDPFNSINENQAFIKSILLNLNQVISNLRKEKSPSL